MVPFRNTYHSRWRELIRGEVPFEIQHNPPEKGMVIRFFELVGYSTKYPAHPKVTERYLFRRIHCARRIELLQCDQLFRGESPF